MYDRVAVALDGSPTALGAVGPARRIARLHDAELLLVSVATEGDDRAHEVLAEGSRRVGSGVAAQLVEGSDAADALAAFDAADPRTLLCMTTRGVGAARRALLGSTALSVVQRSPFAVVLVGPNCDRTRETPIEPIVACLDGTVDGEAVLPWVMAWSRRIGSSIRLLRVMYPVGEPGVADPPGERFLDDLAYLERVRDRLGEIEVRHQTVPHVAASVAIADELQGFDDALLAVSTSHPGALADLVRGSATGELIRSVTVPVLVVSKTGTVPPPARSS